MIPAILADSATVWPELLRILGREAPAPLGLAVLDLEAAGRRRRRAPAGPAEQTRASYAGAGQYGPAVLHSSLLL